MGWKTLNLKLISKKRMLQKRLYKVSFHSKKPNLNLLVLIRWGIFIWFFFFKKKEETSERTHWNCFELGKEDLFNSGIYFFSRKKFIFRTWFKVRVIFRLEIVFFGWGSILYFLFFFLRGSLNRAALSKKFIAILSNFKKRLWRRKK